jgi:hypothetical protein
VRAKRVGELTASAIDPRNVRLFIVIFGFNSRPHHDCRSPAECAGKLDYGQAPRRSVHPEGVGPSCRMRSPRARPSGSSRRLGSVGVIRGLVDLPQKSLQGCPPPRLSHRGLRCAAGRWWCCHYRRSGPRAATECGGLVLGLVAADSTIRQAMAGQWYEVELARLPAHAAKLSSSAGLLPRGVCRRHDCRRSSRS